VSGTIDRIGLDVGTYNLVLAKIKDEKLELKKETNCFYQIENTNKFMLNMLKQSGAPFVEIDNNIFILGESSRQLAISMNQDYRRPMKNGILSVEEKSSFNILALMIRSLIGNLSADQTILYFTVPANAINTVTNAEYHQKVIQSILDRYKQEGKILRSFPVNEAFCIIAAELTSKQRSGIALSFGSGMINVCAAKFSIPLFQFSLTDSGDWLDAQAARHCGEKASYINEAKKSIDLSKDPSSAVERSIIYHYQIMIENAIKGIVDGIRKTGSKMGQDDPVDIVVAGGTASPKYFIEFFKEVLNRQNFPIPIGEIRLAKDHLYTVAKGALILAESHED
jgi:hypothetical protein